MPVFLQRYGQTTPDVPSAALALSRFSTLATHRPYGFALVMNVSLNPSGSVIENVRMPQPSCGS
jgi:hypothetical protein